jgi:dihydroorotate dehydrogenase electron transfer subunit
MQINTRKISVIRIEADGNRTAQLNCQPGGIPRSGQYLLGHHPDEPETALGRPLFQVGLPILDVPETDTNAPLSITLGPIPRSWHPGASIILRGPLGKGFQIPPAVHNLGLIALGESANRLLPLIPEMLARQADIAIFSDHPLPTLPAAVETRPLRAIAEVIAWADFLALDISLDNIPQLRKNFGLDQDEYLPCPAQVLVTTPMPCAGIADCGVCAVTSNQKGYRLACKDGPVFNLNQLAW